MNEINSWKISSQQGRGQVCGRHTEICITEFRDKYLVIVTDSGKIGSFVHVDYRTSEFKSPENDTYNAKVIFGRDEPEIQAVALTLAETYFHKSILLGFSLKECNQNAVKDLKNLVSNTVKGNTN